jgi:3-deoxy-7-phosphoheptulonate synthase
MARAAGQYAKPRSASVEVRDGAALPSYLGDVVNGEAFDAAVREPDPSRMLVARSCAEKTLSFIGQETFGEERRYFVSHEALLLEYEQQFLHDVGDQRYHLGTHMVWIGERTRSLKSPHVAMLAAVANPLGLKVGPETNPVELTAIVQKVTAHRRNRPILLITRLGAGAVRAKLPALVDAMAHEQRKTLWICDPMHGNTFTARSGRKTRSFDAVLQEINETVSLHAALGSNLDGLSLESAATMVTECVGGPDQLTEGDLSAGYETACDPRLNPRQLTALLRSVAACRRVLLPQAACGNPYRDCAADQDRCLGMTFASEPPVLVSQLSKRPQLSKGHST